MLEQLVTAIVDFISNSGYLGIFVLMTLESALIPIPSEIIMPFSGYLVYTGKFGFLETVLAGTLGNLFGSLIAYDLGNRLGRKWLEKYLKFMHKEKLMNKVDNWILKYGCYTAFFSRMMPAIRTFVSFPLGISKMNLKKFCILTFLGSFIWCIPLTYSGIILGPYWQKILDIFHTFEILFFIIFIFVIFIYFEKRKIFQ
ncbi:MAG: DedA family protein [Candidatus Aenigmarchaeota archaeon]|nr:DedA family protein [Candidatus Aenigmarchaeota archaeon]